MDPNQLYVILREMIKAACADGALEWSVLAEFEEQWANCREKLPVLEAKIAELEAALQQSLEPPLRYAIFLAHCPGDERDVIVASGGARLEARLTDRVAPLRETLVPGQEVLLNGQQNVVAVRGMYAGGETAEVINILKPDLAAEVLEVVRGTPESPLALRVRWREGEEIEVSCAEELRPEGIRRGHVVALDEEGAVAIARVRPRLHVRSGGSEGIVVEISDQLFEQGVQIGDIVRVETGIKFAFEKLPAYETGGLTLEDIPDVSYEDIGGLGDQIEQVQDAIELPYLFRTQFEQYQLSRPKGILLYGPPGCGKTMIAKAVANSLTHTIRAHLVGLEKRIVLFRRLEADPDDAEALAAYRALLPAHESGNGADLSGPAARDQLETFLRHHRVDLDDLDRELATIRAVLNAKDGIRGFFLNVKGPELLDKYVGETEHRIRKIFEEARRYATFYTPVVIFFDEMESMFRARGSGRSSDVETTIVPQFLAELDGVEASENLIIIGASNRADLIDSAIMRPGRLDIKIKIDRPTPEAAREVCALYLLPTLPLNPVDVPVEEQDGPGQIVFRTAYRLAGDTADPLARFGPVRPLVEHLPPGGDFRLALAFTPEDRARLAELPPALLLREAVVRLDDDSRLAALLRRLPGGSRLGEVVAHLTALGEALAADETLAGHARAQARQEWLAEAMILDVIEMLYSPASLMNVLTGSGQRYTFYVKDFMSGAVIANIIARAKKSAVKRVVLGHAAAPQGIGLADLHDAIRQELEESKDQLAQNKLARELGLGEQLKFVELVLRTGEVDPWDEPKLRPYEASGE